MGDIIQTSLLDIPEKWESEWVDMPEFVQDKRRPFAQVIIRFESQEDMDRFSELTGQKLTRKTKSMWYPIKSHWGDPINKKVYVDEP